MVVADFGGPKWQQSRDHPFKPLLGNPRPWHNSARTAHNKADYQSRDGTVPLDESLSETVEFLGRRYQTYALAHNIYFAPIDEVRRAVGGN